MSVTKNWTVLLLILFAAPALALDFSLPDINGKAHKLSHYRGKWVVVNVWATWCPPCLREIPDLMAFHEEHKNTDAVVLGVNYEEIDIGELKIFVKDLRISYPILVAKPGIEKFLGPLPSFPTSIIYDPNGLPADKIEGVLTRAQLEAYIRRGKPKSETDKGFKSRSALQSLNNAMQASSLELRGDRP